MENFKDMINVEVKYFGKGDNKYFVSLKSHYLRGNTDWKLSKKSKDHISLFLNNIFNNHSSLKGQNWSRITNISSNLNKILNFDEKSFNNKNRPGFQVSE
jgi:hypothetical protein